MDPAVEAELERAGAERRGLRVASATGLVVRLAQVAMARWCLRRCNQIGRWTRVMFGRPIVDNQGRIELASRVRLMSEFAPVELRTAPSGRLTVGERTGINYGTSFHVVDSVQIGANVDFGPHCIITDSDTGSVDRFDPTAARPVVIGDGAWLASRVTVLPGSTIGAGSIIAAGSVVDGAIPANVLAGGIPARVLRSLDADGGETAALTPVTAVAPAAAVPAPAPIAVIDHSPRPVAGRGLLISDFTVDQLAQALRRPDASVRLEAEIAPFGAVVPTLLEPRSSALDFAVVWTRPDGMLPAIARLLGSEAVGAAEIDDDVDRFAALVEQGLRDVPCVIVPTWTVPPWLAGGALTEGRPGGVSWALSVANQRLMRALGDTPNVFVLDAQRWISAVGAPAYSERLWFLGKIPFNESVFEHAADDIAAALLAVRGGGRKLVIVDLDNTLWGGVVGDDGWEALRLGGHDSAGEAFVEFQRALKQLTRRGILLAIASKNDEKVALEAIERHSAMVLQPDDFVTWRIDWSDKAANIADLVAELNLGLQSVVFLDDNPHERERIRAALPEVLVPELPADPASYARILLALTCFDSPTVSAEDASRTQLYAGERRRAQLRESVGSLDDWIRELDVVVRAEPLGAHNLPRAAQLLNKTNQMNLSTRRLSESELTEWAGRSGNSTWCISVSDRLGDAGLTGIVSVSRDDDVVTLVDYVLSCRVMGRRVEQAMLHIATRLGAEQPARCLRATLIPTAKNDPCRRFFDGAGLSSVGELTYEWDLATRFPAPADITIELSATTPARAGG